MAVAWKEWWEYSAILLVSLFCLNIRRESRADGEFFLLGGLLGGSSGLLDVLRALGDEELDVAVGLEIGVDASVRSVGSSSALGSLVHLEMRHDQVVDFQALHLWRLARVLPRRWPQRSRSGRARFSQISRASGLGWSEGRWTYLGSA